jgi:hypothetical protein
MSHWTGLLLYWLSSTWVIQCTGHITACIVTSV